MCREMAVTTDGHALNSWMVKWMDMTGGLCGGNSSAAHPQFRLANARIMDLTA